MYVDSKTAEENAVLNAAYAVCAAARTAPKACGTDYLHTAVLTGADKDAVALEMRKLSETLKAPFFNRDADNVDKSIAIVLVGITDDTRGLGTICGLCHFED